MGELIVHRFYDSFLVNFGPFGAPRVNFVPTPSSRTRFMRFYEVSVFCSFRFSIVAFQRHILKGLVNFVGSPFYFSPESDDGPKRRR